MPATQKLKDEIAEAHERIGLGRTWAYVQYTRSALRLFSIGIGMILVAFVILLSAGLLWTQRLFEIPTTNIRLLYELTADQKWTSFNEVFRTIGSLIAGVAFAIGLVQWRAARYESSFEKYYDRLKLANDRFDEAFKSRLKEDPHLLQKHLYTMFVFSELDNLEYIIEKRSLRYVHRDQVNRTFHHFRARCRDRDDGRAFRAEVWRWVGKNGDSEAAGYQERTRKAASFLANCATPAEATST